jgi:hypothetical protein
MVLSLSVLADATSLSCALAETASWMLDGASWMLDVASWLLDVASWALDAASWALDGMSRMLTNATAAVGWDSPTPAAN